METLTIIKGCEVVLIEKIEQYLTEESKKHKTKKIYFSGEGDSNQSLFEKKSNNMKIGVLATTEKIGLMLLRLLRLIIDDDLQSIVEYALGYDDDDNQREYGSSRKIKDIVKDMGSRENEYSSKFLLRKNYIIDENNRPHKDIKEIHIWEINDIFSYIKNYF